MTDNYDSIIADDVQAGQAAVSTNLDAKPDDGAKALQLSQDTGVPSMAIYNDLPNFQKRYKARLANQILLSHEELNNFVQSHPLAPVVANDDYGNLSQVSAKSKEFMQWQKDIQAGAWWSGNYTDSPIRDAFDAAAGRREDLGKWITADPAMQNHPVLAGALASNLLPLEVGFRGAMGLFNAANEFAGQVAKRAYQDVYGYDENDSRADQFGRQVSAMVEKHFTFDEAGHVPEPTARAGQVALARGKEGEPAAKQVIAQQQQFDKDRAYGQAAWQAGKQWFENGLSPPSGIHPLIDEMKGVTNQSQLLKLNAALDDAQNSALRQRVPSLFNGLMADHYGTAEIGVNGDLVSQFYGTNRPSIDDGFLGWVPGIEDKLALARATGEDVGIPIKDWLTYADPRIAAELDPHLRMWPEGITKVEASPINTLVPDTVEAGVIGGRPAPEYKPTVDAPMAAVRGAYNTEPQFSIGDRKLQLQRLDSAIEREAMGVAYDRGIDWTKLDSIQQKALMDEVKANQPPWTQGFHDFQLLDHNGNPVGYLNLSEQKGGKQLHVDMISGVNGFGPRDFGPSLVIDLAKQIANEFPEAETLTGHRVSGARDKAGSYKLDSAMPVINLDRFRARFDVPRGWDKVEAGETFRQILEGGEWKAFHPTVEGYVKQKFDANTQAINDAVRDEFLKRVPGGRVQFVQRIRSLGSYEIHGVRLSNRGLNSLILLATDVEDRMGVMHHEAIHELRELFTDKEWMRLEQASREGDWQGKFDVEGRWGKWNLTLGKKLEESIAEGYRAWEAGKAEVGPQLHPIFQKIKDFLDAIRQRINEILGRPGTVDDIFERVGSGEVGRRAGEAEAGEPQFSIGPEKPSYVDVLNRLRADNVGLNADSFKKIQDAIHERYAEDRVKAQQLAEKEQTTQQTKEWKANYSETKTDVEQRLRNRPDIAADLFFSAGDYFGKKVDKKPRIASGDLTEEQKAALPPNYYAKSGLPLDPIAKAFGFTSGDAMVNSLIRYRESRGDGSAVEALGRLVKNETDRQMQAKHGRLEDNIMEAAKDQAVSETDLNVLAEEMYAAASIAKVQLPIDKASMIRAGKDYVLKLPMSSINADRFADTMAKHSHAASVALLNGDPATAIVKLQQRLIAAAGVAQARELRKIYDGKGNGSFEKMAKGLSKVDQPSIDPEYRNYIHQALQQIGYGVARLPENIQADIIGRGGKDLTTFMDDQYKQGREIHDSEILMSGTKKGVPNMTAKEFLDVNDAMKSLRWNGRDLLKVTREGDTKELKSLMGELASSLTRFPSTPSKAVPVKGVKYRLASGVAALVKMETLFNRLDGYDWFGPWQQFGLRGLIDGIHERDGWLREHAKTLHEIDDGVNLSKLVDNPIGFGDPSHDPNHAFSSLTRGQLRAIMLNAGTESNLVKFAKGYGKDPQKVIDWLRQAGTKEDWDWVQNVWDKIFKNIGNRADNMRRGITGGVVMEKVPPRPIDVTFADGTTAQYAGGYYPIIPHVDIKGKTPKSAAGSLLDDNYFRSTTPPDRYMLTRTGDTRPLSFDINQMASRIRQMEHDIAMRPALLQAQKIFQNDKIYNAIRTRFGPEYANLLEPYIQDVANSTNFKSEWQNIAAQTSEFFRQNLITTLVGLNPGTVLKHGPTAWIQSMNQVGSARFLKAMSSLLATDERTGESNWQFAMNTFDELSRRYQNARESLSGALEDLQGPGANKFMSLRDTVIRFASSPIALSDLVSAVPTALAEYRRLKELDYSEGDAISGANRAVRLAHGSSAITNRPGVMRGGPGSQWLVSVYNFYNHMANKNIEIYWRAQDALGLAKIGELEKAKEVAKPIIGLTFAYVIAPAVIGGAVAWAAGQKFASFADWAKESLIHNISGNVPVVRDVVDAWLHKKDPTVGLMSTFAQEAYTAFTRDLGKDRPFSKEHMGRLIQDGVGSIGAMTGMMPQQIGRVARFFHDIQTGQVRPKGMEYVHGIMRGSK